MISSHQQILEKNITYLQMVLPIYHVSYILQFFYSFRENTAQIYQGLQTAAPRGSGFACATHGPAAAPLRDCWLSSLDLKLDFRLRSF